MKNNISKKFVVFLPGERVERFDNRESRKSVESGRRLVKEQHTGVTHLCTNLIQSDSRVLRTSSFDTLVRLRSPPDTPRTCSLPMMVPLTFFRPSSSMTSSTRFPRSVLLTERDPRLGSESKMRPTLLSRSLDFTMQYLEHL